MSAKTVIHTMKETTINILNCNENAKKRKKAERMSKIFGWTGAVTAVAAAIGARVYTKREYKRIGTINEKATALEKRAEELTNTCDDLNDRLNAYDGGSEND